MSPPQQPPSLTLFPSLKNKPLIFHQTLTLTLTFLAYASLHASRKPPSIVKSILGPQIPTIKPDPVDILAPPQMGWAPFNGTHGTHRLGELDLAFLSCYAFGMFFSGHFADTYDLRLFLCFGMLLSGLFTVGFGLGFWFRVHLFVYFVVVQVLCGLVQSTGWPSVVAVVGNWFGGSSKKGLIMGIWNSHTSVGNILGSVVASSMIKYGWGWSFFWPGLFVFLMGIVVYFFLVVSPQVVGFCVESEIELNGNVEAEHLGLLHSDGTDSLGVSVGFVSKDVNSSYGIELNGSVKDGIVEGEHLNLVDLDGTDHLGVSEGFVSKDGDSSDAIGFIEAWRLPGVAPFAICLFFSKLVAYTFLYWLPFYIRHTAVAGVHLSHETAGLLSTIFDIGGVLGGVMAGLISDKLRARATTSVSFLLLSIPALVLYRVYGSKSMSSNNALMFLCGVLVNGPYALITTAVAADLGMQSAISGNSRALATVTAIIDGTGSIGAAIGPLLVGYISTSGWNTVFAMLIASVFTAALCLIPAVISEMQKLKSGVQMNGTAY